MLRIKYFKEFENGSPFLVILGDKEDFDKAYHFFVTKKSGYLNDPALVANVDILPLEQNTLFLNEQECRDISLHFKNLSLADIPSHIYFDTDALGNEIEGMISYLEYDDLL